MKKKIYNITGIFSIFCFIFVSSGFAADTCMFTTTADDIPPLIVLLLDNGAEMEYIVWHSGYDNSIVYPAAGSVFTNANGYGFDSHGGKYYIVPILSDLTLGTYTHALSIEEDSGSTWIINGNTVTLPAAPSSSVDGDGIIDNATHFRYSTNYLNWIFYSGLYAGNGSNLPDKSRFYYAKKAIFSVARLTANSAKFGVYNFTATASGASNVQPLGLVVDTPLAANPANNTLDSSFVNNINNMGTVAYSPLAEGLASVGGYYASASSGVVGEYCQKLFSLVITPGVSSEDQAIGSSSSPTSFSDYDGDGEGSTVTISGTTYTVPLNQNGSTYLDDIAYYLYTNDIPQYSAAPGFQRVATYTIGFMGDDATNAFLMNTSNNGNGITDPNDEDYGSFHFVAEDPDNLTAQLLAALSTILSETSTFTAPVVPVTRTTSGEHIYMAFFKPQESNFWDGNVTKFGVQEDASGQIIITDMNGNPATWPNGAIKEGAVPYWTTIDWADSSKTNYMHNASRTIYAGNTTTVFSVGNMTAAMLGSPTSIVVNGTTITGVEKVVNYIRGADVLDEDSDLNTTENRSIITGDILHSEPAVVEYSNAYSSDTFVYYGSNDGMLHAVKDSNGTEEWGFIPSDLIIKLKDILEGTEHQYFIDSSPKVFMPGGNGDGVVDVGETAILICGERRGGSYYFLLDITNPGSPSYIGNICTSGCTVNIPEFGETWSEPKLGKVDNSGSIENALFIGGGYSSDNSSGNAVAVVSIDSSPPTLIKKWNDSDNTDMTYSIPGAVKLVDENNNGITDKIYVGDLGGQMWRFGKFTEVDGITPLTFPNSDENISTWVPEVLFKPIDPLDPAALRKIYYPPAVTMEKGFDMVFFGTGDRDDACNTSTSDRIYAVKDVHSSTAFVEVDLVDVTDPMAALPDLPTDNGFYIQLSSGEKVLSESMVFYKTLYATTFIPGSTDPCVPGGDGRIYALNYLTGGATIDFTGDDVPERTLDIGGGIPSKPVMVIPPGDAPPRILISVGSTKADGISEEHGAGTLTINPKLPTANFFYLWWRLP